ncbi:CinA family nicotinamide mononucleotide deamidase-related protein [Myroides sp. 1354]|uniref:CinA family nicotinamide mononucleotide deamidase-related protein n=1 Tax=unclassified Myroides TaxID=2642485 RepID=UPI0025791D70|nr:MULTISPECIES: CinA family nicotinamide mononucleotide deamidase-related protein [unclassified Myroides]MDM1045367.1 CinA family nicotinamide mononucleotide deamidase-related protein [Myroides sp. R163-1]MDM1056396.1 CinA family nicotinamide mononucleotide deamidase-related protein [Myroides sp. 1354]MDM1069498.1 CinA family nicotinamide mononucleotide deamidase-related protein [Myroides sp. 1372]
MKASILTIGDEILIGQIVDTNSNYLAKYLDKLGFEIVEMLSIADSEIAIKEAMNRQLNRVDVVVITGGLGPTKDDLTKQVFCDFFDDVLVENQAVFTHVKQLIEGYFNRPISDLNRKQALVPSKARVLFNELGTAPGMLLKKEQTYFIALPGVPFEMIGIVEKELTPILKEQFALRFNVHKTIVVYGIGESLLAEYLAEWEDALPNHVQLAYLPSRGRVRLRLSSTGTDKLQIETTLAASIKAIPQKVKDHIRAYDDLSRSDVVIEKLKAEGLTIACAESCTGGRLAVLFSAKEGASAYFKGGMVTYATQSKIDVLGVKKETIETYSVVSAQVACEMAQQARQKFDADIAVATTGNAGPSKGDSAVEIGTVYVGIASNKGTYAVKYELGQPREQVIERTISRALELVYNEILKK